MTWWLQRSAITRSDDLNRRMPGGLSLFLVALLVIGADQISKFLIRANMELGQSIPDKGILRITYTTNTGGAFGLFSNETFLLVVAAIIGIAILILYLRYLPLGSTVLKIGLGLDLGGALGNLIDRLRVGEVTDFIDFGWWPVFNIADSAITVGTFLIAYYLLFVARKKAS